MASITNIQRLAAKLGLHHLAKQNFRIREEGIPNLEFLELVLSKELELRENKRTETLREKARLPEEKSLDTYNLDYQKGISKWQIDKLAEIGWVDDKYSLLLMGEAGTGKTHLAIGIAMKAMEKGHKTFYTILDNLLYMLKTKDTIVKSKFRLKYIDECKLLVLDEVGYLSLSAEDAKTIYAFIDNHNKKISLIIITNREFESWKDLFYDEMIATTLLDRVIEKCQVIKLTGESYRFLHNKKIYAKQNTK